MTNEMLPSDILGYGVYVQGEVEVVKGPIFNNVVLIDEINRAPPRTLSALIEPMQERTVTIEGVTFKLPDPHMVIATINLTEVARGATQPLPYAVTDRFTAALTINYADVAREKEIVRLSEELEGLDGRPQGAAPLSASIRGVYGSDLVVEYIIQLVEHIRRDERVEVTAVARRGVEAYRAARRNYREAVEKLVEKAEVLNAEAGPAADCAGVLPKRVVEAGVLIGEAALARPLGAGRCICV